MQTSTNATLIETVRQLRAANEGDFITRGEIAGILEGLAIAIETDRVLGPNSQREREELPVPADTTFPQAVDITGNPQELGGEDFGEPDLGAVDPSDSQYGV